MVNPSFKSAGALALSTLLSVSSAWQHGGPPGGSSGPWGGPYSYSYPSYGRPTSTLPSSTVVSSSSSVHSASSVASSSVVSKASSATVASSSVVTKASSGTVASSSIGTTASSAGITTFSVPTASTANPTASVPTIDEGTEVIQYSTVGGYFLQDLNSTVASTFDFTATNFGLINQTYSSDCSATAGLTQWQRFNRVVYQLNQLAPSNTVYKLLFIGRHGEGYHNAAQTYYGTPAWNCYWAELDGNGTSTWADAHLTTNGIAQAVNANLFWQHEINVQGIEVPQSYYVSPLTRCLQTANYTYSNLTLPSYYPFVPTVKEFFRESISIHTCDRRSNKTYIANSFPTYKIDPELTEYDEIWNGITAETSSAQDYRSKIVLDQVFNNDPSTIISVTTHSGEAGSLLRVLGHQAFSLVTGEIIPVLVKAQFVSTSVASTTTQPWTTSAWCTNGPPLSSATTGASQCVCSNGVLPTATTIAS